MAQPATRYPSQELAGINFGQAKFALEQRFLEERNHAATKSIDGGALAAKKQKISSVSISLLDAIAERQTHVSMARRAHAMVWRSFTVRHQMGQPQLPCRDSCVMSWRRQ